MSSNELRSRRSRYSDHQYQNSSIYNGSVKSSLNNFSVDLPHNRKKVNTIEKQIISKQNLAYKTIINLTNTKYAILQEVSGPQNLNWKVQTFGQTKHWTIKWCDTGMTNQILQRMHYLQKINHFPSTNVITRKNNLAMTLTKMKQQFPNQYNFYPRTFLYPKESSKVLHYYVQSRKKGLLKTFIIKPQAGCQGRGIFLTQNYGQIQKQQQCIVQKYISNPLLYQGLKFDLRIYVLLSCCNPLRIYLYNQGLVRFATEKYSFPLPQNLNNLFVHLTNYAINKSNPDYQYNYSINDMAFGHKKSLAQFFKILKDLGYRANSYWSQIKDCIIKTLIAAQPFILSNYKTCRPNDATYNMCFQVFGFDFMIDNRDQCFLLEVNHTPSFTTDTPLDHIIKKNLIKDTLLMMNPSFEQIKLRQQLERSKQRDKYIKFKNSNQNLAFHRQQLIKQINKIRQSHQQAFKGTYELIYPSKNSNKQTNYERLLSASIRNSYSAGQSSKSAYSASNLRSMLFQSSNNQKIISKNSLAKINQHPQIANKKNIIYNYNYIKGNMTNKKGLSTLPVEIISNKKQKSKNDRFIRVNSSQKLKTQMTAKKQIREIKQPSNIRHSKFQYIPQQNSYKSEQKRNRLAVVQESRQRMKTNPSEERGKVNSEINSFTKRIRAYKTPLM